MKTLLMKEWREQRVMVVLALLLMGLAAAYVRAGGPADRLADRADMAVGIFTFIFPALFVAFFGSIPFCGEFTQGTDTFLASLPVSAGTVFWTKYAAGLSTTLLLLCGSTALAAWAAALSGGSPMVTDPGVLLYAGLVLVLHAAMVLSAVLLRNTLVAILCVPFVAALGAAVLAPIVAAIILASPYGRLVWAGGLPAVLGFLLSSALIVWRTTAAGKRSVPASFARIWGAWAVAALLLHAAAWTAARVSLARATAEARREGIRTRMEEIVPPPVPEDRNGAPFFTEAFAVLARVRAKHAKALTALETGEAGGSGEPAAPEAIRSLRRSPEMREFFRLVEAATEKPDCRFPIRYEDGPAMLLPHLSNFRSAARLLQGETRSLLEEGRPAEAVRRAAAGLRLGDALAGERLMISQLVRVAVDAVAIKTARTAVDAGACGPAEIRALLDIIGKKNPSIAAGLEGELALQQVLFEPRRGAQSILTGRTPPPAVFLLRPLLAYNRALAVRGMTASIRAMRRPYHAGTGAAALDERLEERIRRGEYRIAYAGMLLPTTRHFAEQQARYRASLETARLGLLLRLDAARTGGYPAALDALPPEYGGKLPADPFTGAAYVYRRRGTGFILYSVGPNGRDEGGASSAALSSKAAKGPDDIAFSLSR